MSDAKEAKACLEESAKRTLVSALLVSAETMGLEIIHKITVDEVMAIYNGVGPEWMKKSWREVLDKYSTTLLPAVFVHDIDYAYGDGTLLDFQKANKRLEANGIKCADAAYPWWHPMRYIVRRQAKAYAKICNALGFVAYTEAIEKTRKKNNKEKT